MNAQAESRQVIRSVDFLIASGLLAAGSLLLLLSSIAFTMNQDFRLLGLVPLAMFLHFLGWNALAGWMTVPAGGGPEDPRHLRQSVFAASPAAFLLGFMLLLSLDPGSIPQVPSVPYFFGVLLIPLLPAVYAPVVLVHVAIFWWGSGALCPLRLQLLIRVGALVLVAIAGVGLLVQRAIPGLLFNLLSLVGLTGAGYLLVALGWWAQFRQDGSSASSSF